MPRLKKKKTAIILIFAVVLWLIWYKSRKSEIKKCSTSSVVPHLVDPRKYNHDNRLCGNESNFCIKDEPQVDIQMLNVYSKISFRNNHGGDWEEGWCVQDDPNAWTADNKLKVFVVPHSHNDPGWLYTFDEYYLHSTKFILHGVLRNLKEHNELTFVWSEISYFSRWYESLSMSQKQDVQSLINAGRLEIVSGGWVMPDEANSHWYSLVMQLSEGQRWIRKHLNVTPTVAWSIDPFGHSPTMAYVLQEAGFKQMVIGRTHYIVKKHFAMYRDLEFRWKQNWDSRQNSGIFTHMLPFSSYAIKYSHGPYPRITFLFDFRKSEKWYWPWEEQPQEITKENIEKRSDLLIDQWKKKASLYQTKAILVPHGDDFRYRTQAEWDAQRSNLVKLFKHINASPQYNVHVQFGTLSDYFNEIKDRQEYPSLSGDFFTYADENEDYWSGYFTTRPYHKRKDRILLHLIRSAEIWNTLYTNGMNEQSLEVARRAHSLYQHHDGITGTAKEKVVENYAEMNENAIQNLYNVLKLSTDDEVMSDSIGDISKKNGTKYLRLFNSLPQTRTETIEIFSSTFSVVVKNELKEAIPFQISPAIEWIKGWIGIYIPKLRKPETYRITFVAEIRPLSAVEYSIEENSKSELAPTAILTNFTIFHDPSHFELPSNEIFRRQFTFKSTKESTLAHRYRFDEKGFLQSIKMDEQDIKVEINFLKYLTHRWWSDKSGAYLFLPRGQAQSVYTQRRSVVIAEGPIECRAASGFQFGIHETIIKDDHLEIFNRIDIENRDDQEIVMRLETDIQSGDMFFTDLNGFQILKRNHLKKLPLQANYYPVPSTIFIQDENFRLTLLTAQPLGGSSLKSGQIELMQDRRLTESDGRGLGEGVMDNLMTINSFRVVLEKRVANFVSSSHPSGFHTRKTHRESLSLLNTIVRMISSTSREMHAPLGGLTEGFEVVVLRRLSNVDIGLVLHKTYLEEENPDLEFQVNLKNFLKLDDKTKIYRSNILLTELYEEVIAEIIFKPMETKAFLVRNF